MRILLVGDGAREHAIAVQLARSSELYSVMHQKNPGIAKLSQASFISEPTAVEVIGSWAIKRKVELAFITSETALQSGLCDALEDAGIALACPTMSAATVGNNTLYALNLMDEQNIPHPDYVVCKNKPDIDLALLEFGSAVIKPTIRTELRGSKFSDKDFTKKKDIQKHGALLIKRHGSVIFEKMVDGEVFSVQAFSDGKRISAMPPVGVASRIMNGNGELTEGIGGYSSGKILPFIKARNYESARLYLAKIMNALNKRGSPYKGAMQGRFLVVGDKTIMLDINSTMGSVESVNNLGILRSQLSETLRSIADSNLKSAAFDEDATVSKFVFPDIFPRKTRVPREIKINEKIVWENGSKIFFESVERIKGKYLAGERRALAVFARGKNLEEAHTKVEGAMEGILGKVNHRADIASKEFIEKRVEHVKRLRG
jgi:phosphoribosylamine--glycine ligase